MADDASHKPPAPDHPPGPSAAGSQPPELPVLRFGLRQMLAFVAVLCALLAAIVTSNNGITALVLLLAALVISLHVTGTALGSRLRAHADRQRAWDAAHAPPVSAASTPTAAQATASTVSPLYGRRSSLRWLPVLVVGGAAVGTLAGALLLAATIGHRTGVVGIVVGSLSLGVVGGWFAFLGTSFWTILRQGWREAVDHQKQDEARRAAQRR